MENTSIHSKLFMSLKILIIAICISCIPLIFSGCTSCSSETQQNSNEPLIDENAIVPEVQKTGESIDSPNAPDENILVVYFSASGYTQQAAINISKELYDCDLFQIVPEEEYTWEDLDEENPDCRTAVESRDKSILPGIKNKVANWEQYDVVFLGYPIWYKEAPNIIYTFVSQYDWSGKTIIPFCTSSRSVIGKSAMNLEPYAKGNPTWEKGKRFAQTPDAEQVYNWLIDIGFKARTTWDPGDENGYATPNWAPDGEEPISTDTTESVDGMEFTVEEGETESTADETESEELEEANETEVIPEDNGSE